MKTANGKPVKSIDANGNEVLYPSILSAAVALDISAPTARKYLRNGEMIQFLERPIRIVFADEESVE